VKSNALVESETRSLFKTGLIFFQANMIQLSERDNAFLIVVIYVLREKDFIYNT